MRMCPHPNIAFSSARIRCDAADRGSRVRHHPPASGGHPAHEKHVLTDQKRRRKGEDPLRRRHTEGQQQSKDRESARARGGWGGWCAGLMCVPPPTNRMSKIPERVVEKQLGRPHSSSSNFSLSSVRSAQTQTLRALEGSLFLSRTKWWCHISKDGLGACGMCRITRRVECSVVEAAVKAGSRASAWWLRILKGGVGGGGHTGPS